MEFAAITETLLIDADGIYDPADVNDRMLLGLKGTMGEVELHVMAQRLQASKKAAAARGELRTPLPVGYVHDEAGEVVIDPDAEVAAAIRDLFAAFAACGSAYGVVAAFAGRRFPLRAYGGAWAGQLRWGRAHPRPRAGRAEEPVLRGGLRARPLHLAAQRRSRRHGAHRGDPTAPGRVAGADQRPPRGIPQLGRLPGQRGQAGAPTAPTPAPGHPGRARRCVRASSPAGPAASRCAPTTTATSARPTSARVAPTGSPPPPADPSRQPPWTPRSPSGCWPRSVPPRSPSPWPPPTRSPIGASGPAGPPSSRSNAPATRPTAPNAPSARSSRRTGWSPAPWRPAGRPDSPPWPRPSRPWPRPTTRCRRYPAASSCRTWPPTSPHSGARPPPATRTANGCCAP